MVYIVREMQETNCYAVQSRGNSPLFVKTKIGIIGEAAFIWTLMDGEDFDGHRGTVKNVTKQAKEEHGLCPDSNSDSTIKQLCDLGQVI